MAYKKSSFFFITLIALSSVLALLLMPPFSLLSAQEASVCTDSSRISANVYLEPARDTVLSGDAVSFILEIKNPTDKDAQGANIIFEMGFLNTGSSGEGKTVIERVLVEEIYLSAGEERSMDFIYHLPSSIPSGSYEARAWVEHPVFIGLGSAGGRTAALDVSGENTYALFDESGAMANGISLFSEDGVITVGDQSPIVLDIPISNSLEQDVEASVSWTVYKHYVSPNNVIEAARTAPVSLLANEDSSITVVIYDKIYSSYVIETSLSYDGMSSLVDIPIFRIDECANEAGIKSIVDFSVFYYAAALVLVLIILFFLTRKKKPEQTGSTRPGPDNDTEQDVSLDR